MTVTLFISIATVWFLNFMFKFVVKLTVQCLATGEKNEPSCLFRSEERYMDPSALETISPVFVRKLIS